MCYTSLRYQNVQNLSNTIYFLPKCTKLQTCMFFLKKQFTVFCQNAYCCHYICKLSFYPQKHNQRLGIAHEHEHIQSANLRGWYFSNFLQLVHCLLVLGYHTLRINQIHQSITKKMCCTEINHILD